MRSIRKGASELLGCQKVTVFLIDDFRKVVWSEIEENDKSLLISLPFGEGIAGYVAESGALLHIRDT